MHSKLLLLILSLSLFGLGQAQSLLSNLFINSTSSEERLLHQKDAGPYVITIDGERLLERAYFKLDITENGSPIPADSNVTIVIDPAASAKSERRSYTAVHNGNVFVVDPINFHANADWGRADWIATITVDSNAGKASTTFGFQVYAPKPEQNTIFSIFSVALPILFILVLLGSYALRGTRLEQASFS